MYLSSERIGDTPLSVGRVYSMLALVAERTHRAVLTAVEEEEMDPAAESVIVGTELIWPTSVMMKGESRVNFPVRADVLRTLPRPSCYLAHSIESNESYVIRSIKLEQTALLHLGLNRSPRSPAIKLRYQSIMIDIFYAFVQPVNTSVDIQARVCICTGGCVSLAPIFTTLSHS